MTFGGGRGMTKRFSDRTSVVPWGLKKPLFSHHWYHAASTASGE